MISISSIIKAINNNILHMYFFGVCILYIVSCHNYMCL